MKRLWGGLLLFSALMVIAVPVQADEVEDLKQMVQELKDEVEALKADRTHESGIEQAVDEYLSAQAAEGTGDLAGYMDGKFGFQSAEGGFQLNVGGGIAFDGRFYEPTGAQNNTWDVELIRLRLTGQVGEGWAFKIQPEFTTDGDVYLMDAYIRTNSAAVFGETGSEYFDGIDWTFGQSRVPFSLSIQTSDYQLDTIMRPVMVRALPIGRDIGLTLSNTVADDMLYWALAMTNGENTTNTSDNFWYWARVVFAPWVNDDEGAVKNLHFGLSFGTAHTPGRAVGSTAGMSSAGGGPYGMVGSSSYPSMGNFYPTATVKGREMLWGLELLWWMEQFAVKSEFFYFTQDLADDPDLDSEADTMGFYVTFDYMLTGEEWSEAPSSGIELVAEIEWGEVDAGGDSDEGDFWAYTLGANYYFSQNVRFQFNWVMTDFGDYTYRPSYEDGYVRGGGVDHNWLLRLILTF